MRRERLFLSDIVGSCTKIERYLQDKTETDFESDEILFDAVVRNLQIIGEAARVLPEDIRSLAPDIPWNRVVGLRHILVHQYFGIDAAILWDLCQNYCPNIKRAAETLQNSLENL
ncbi:MAG: DUF86 domain-containing protein [Armatimonadetes bacterium]|nr:DUF86 domain-containing protein [Armatimonadota bacterium]